MAEDLFAVPLTDDVFIEDPNTSVSVGAIRDYNDSILQTGKSLPAPLQLGPVRYSLDGGDTIINAILGQADTGLLTLSREPPAPIQVVDPAAQAQDDIDAILTLLTSGRTDDLLVLLDDQIRIRQGDVIRLRRLLYVHQTALQNAIDIVQTKRIDFLEHKEDTWVDGAIGALFLAIVLTLFPVEAIIGQALLAMSKSAFRVFGAKSVAGVFSAGERLALNQQIAELQNNVKILRGLAKSSGKTRVTSRTKVSPAQTTALQRVGAPAVRDAQTALGAVDRTKKLIADLKAQRTENAQTEKAYRDLLVEHATPEFITTAAKTRSQILTKSAENTAFNNAEKIEQNLANFAAQADAPSPSVLPTEGAPIDIALKAQIQGIYATLLFAAEDTLAGLQEFRNACTSQTPGPEHLAALEEILVAEVDVVKAAGSKAGGSDPSAEQKIDISATDVQELIDRSTEGYEKLIWILMYGNQLVQRRRFGSGAGDDSVVVTSAAPDHNLLLNYLKTRFYPDKSTRRIGLAYEDIFKTINERNRQDATQPLDLSCFANPKKVLDIIKGAQLQKVTLPKDKP